MTPCRIARSMAMPTERAIPRRGVSDPFLSGLARESTFVIESRRRPLRTFLGFDRERPCDDPNSGSGCGTWLAWSQPSPASSRCCDIAGGGLRSGHCCRRGRSLARPGRTDRGGGEALGDGGARPSRRSPRSLALSTDSNPRVRARAAMAIPFILTTSNHPQADAVHTALTAALADPNPSAPPRGGRGPGDAPNPTRRESFPPWSRRPATPTLWFGPGPSVSLGLRADDEGVWSTVLGATRDRDLNVRNQAIRVLGCGSLSRRGLAADPRGPSRWP